MTGPRRRRRWWRGVRTRILAAFIVLLAASTLVSTVALREVLVNRAVERVDGLLTQGSEEFRRLAAEGRDPRSGQPLRDDVRRLFDVYLARNVPIDGEALYTFVDGAPYRASAASAVTGQVTAAVLGLAGRVDGERGELSPSTGRVCYVVVPVRVDGRPVGSLAIVEDLAGEEADAGDAARSAAAISLGVLLVAAALAWLIAGRVLAPLRDLRDTVTTITDSDLSARLVVDGDDEIAELARTFNAMLDRLEGAFDSQRAFVSDVGHELRTPITIVRGHLELLGDDPDERHETMALVVDELGRMSRLVEDLLTLAKAERPDFLRPEELDLDELVAELAGKATALGPRAWSVERADPGVVVADRQRLTQAVMNLAANAVQHTRPGDAIALGGALVAGRARLWVADSGPGVAPADRERIFERFQRAGEQPRLDGAGLGLAIVRVIAEAHGGTVSLESPGRGATFVIALPTHTDTATDIDTDGEDAPP